MDLLSCIASWLGENEATISAVVGIMVLGGALFAGLRSLVRRRGETSQEEAAGAAAESASATDSPPPDLDPLTVPGFEGRPAIAVLPFDNLSGDPDQEYFADGIAEDLITRLSSWREFPVIARNSTFTYKGKSIDVKQVSRELDARYIVEGSVRKVGDRVRISAQLIDANTGHHLWAKNYDRELQDIFALQDEIIEALIGSMGYAVLLSESKRAIHKDTPDLDAFDYRMRGMWHLFKLTKEDNRKAQAFFEKAIELDPEYAEAFATLALTHYVDFLFQWTDSPARSLDAQFQAARTSVKLNSALAEGQMTLAWAHSISGQRDEAIAAARLAVQLDPSLPGANLALGIFLSLTGAPDEGIAHIERAVRLSPEDPVRSFRLNCIAIGHFAAGRYTEAVQWEKQSLQWNPDYWIAHAVLASSHAQLGQIPEAQEAFREMLRVNPEFSTDALKKIFSIADLSLVETILDGLRKAGMKE
jgi:adenylate cyclase